LNHWKNKAKIKQKYLKKVVLFHTKWKLSRI